MRSHVALFLAVLPLFYLFAAVESHADDPDLPAGASELSIYEDGFEVFVGCGDGVIVGPEQCDDSNKLPGDGCNASCEIELGFMCTGQPSVCTTLCGDGLITGTESCDDFNLTNNDGCNASCEIELGFMCTGQPSVCTTLCGDGLITGTESCDDFNLASNDGCDTSCGIENGWVCNGEPSVCAPEP